MKYEQNFRNSTAQIAGKTPCQYLRALGTHLIASFFDVVANSFKCVALEDCDELTPFFQKLFDFVIVRVLVATGQ